MITRLMIVITVTFLPHIVNAKEAEKWLCSDSGDNSIYQVIIGEKLLTYHYQDEFYNRVLDNEYEIQAIDENSTIYAVQQVRATPSAEKGDCTSFCFSGGTVIFDRKEKIIHRNSIAIGFENKEPTESGWQSTHKCTNKF